MRDPVYEVVWPSGKQVPAHGMVPPALRVSDLSGKTICELWDWAFRGEEVFPIIRELLVERYSGIKFVGYTDFGNTHGREEAEVIAALPDLLHRHGCDVVISGVGG